MTGYLRPHTSHYTHHITLTTDGTDRFVQQITAHNIYCVFCNKTEEIWSGLLNTWRDTEGLSDSPTHVVILRLSGSKDPQIHRGQTGQDGDGQSQSQAQAQARPTCSAGNQAGGVAGSYSDIWLSA